MGLYPSSCSFFSRYLIPRSYSTKDSHLELHLTGRKIADEGLELVCSALLEALSGGTLKLDELHLSNNSITAKGLPTLGKVIRAASKQLRDLDLAGNLIKAETESEREAFTGFLRDLGEVECLLRLDFGGNPLGLGFGFEIMLRQYAREKPIRSEDLEARLFEIEEAEAMAKRSKRERGKGRDSGIGMLTPWPLYLADFFQAWKRTPPMSPLYAEAFALFHTLSFLKFRWTTPLLSNSHSSSSVTSRHGSSKDVSPTLKPDLTSQASSPIFRILPQMESGSFQTHTSLKLECVFFKKPTDFEGAGGTFRLLLARTKTTNRISTTMFIEAESWID